MKREKYFAILIITCMFSYFMMINLSITAAAEDLSNYQTNLDSNRRNSLIYELKNAYINEKQLIEYTHSLTDLEFDDCEFIVNECKKRNIDLFIVLGVIKRESDFDPKAQGLAGERGLGQLMENTAKVVAENLGYIYDPNKLYETRYNLKLTITQLAYLFNLYNNEIHMALTAYNRGQQGLVEFMNNSENKNSAASDYSKTVIRFANEYEEGFRKKSDVNF